MIDLNTSYQPLFLFIDENGDIELENLWIYVCNQINYGYSFVE